MTASQDRRPVQHFARVYCEDCGGQDPMGCFEGGSELLGPFDTREEAEAAGVEYTKDCGPWNYEITAETKA